MTRSKCDHLHVSPVGNPSMTMPTMIGGLPGMEALASSMMKKEMARLEIPGVREFLTILSESGAKLYACGLAMDFFDRAAGAQIIFI